MTDPATPVRPDDQPLSDDQLGQIAGGWITFPCDLGPCTKVFASYEALEAHKATPHNK
jgi:hypothetical protein